MDRASSLEWAGGIVQGWRESIPRSETALVAAKPGGRAKHLTQDDLHLLNPPISVNTISGVETGQPGLSGESRREVLDAVHRLAPNPRARRWVLDLWSEEQLEPVAEAVPENLEDHIKLWPYGPAYAFNLHLDMLCQNSDTQAAFGTRISAELPRPNLLTLAVSRRARQVLPRWEDHLRWIVDEFKDGYTRYHADEVFDKRLAEARSICPELEQLWKTALPTTSDEDSHEKRVLIPRLGEVVFSHHVLADVGTGVRAAFHKVIGDDDHAKLATLRDVAIYPNNHPLAVEEWSLIRRARTALALARPTRTL